MIGESGCDSLQGQELFSSTQHSHRLRGQIDREADHSPQDCAEVKSVWNYTFSPLMPSWRGDLLSTGTTYLLSYVLVTPRIWKHVGNDPVGS
jgi:hypothetical protein